MFRNYLVTIIVPVILIALAIPTVLGKVPRNGLYGFRTAYTLSSDEVWYRANKIAGIALLLAGVFWLAGGLILPRVMEDGVSAIRLVQRFGVGGLIISVALSFWLVYKK
jgi:uncharacterized membrane protein